jgi:hypothetical protein
MKRIAFVLMMALGCATALGAQPTHTAGMHDRTGPSQGGQAAFAAIAEVVAILEADSSTDWSGVDVERLRQHLIDMDEVTLNAIVTRQPISGGAVFEVTGQGRTVAAIHRVAAAHAAQGDGGLQYAVQEIPGGSRVTVTGPTPAAERRIRALGFIGLLTLGGHHGPHHLALARGEMPAGHVH